MEPWQDSWADRETTDFKENAQDVEAAVQSLYEDGLQGINIIAKVVSFQ